MSSSSSSEDTDDEEEEEEEESGNESSEEEEEASDASVHEDDEQQTSLENDVAILEEVCADMDAVFARLMMRYPPTRRRNGQMRDDDDDDDTFRGHGRGGDDQENDGRQRQRGPSGSRATHFRRASDRMSTIHGAKRLSAPENERPPLSAECCAELEDLAEEALSAFRRPDREDEYYVFQEDDPSLSWDADNPKDVAAAIRDLSVRFLGETTFGDDDNDVSPQQQYLALSLKLERIDEEIFNASFVG